MSNCEICNFKNPKATVTAAILKDNKVLFLKRNEEPFAGKWDLPGGYMGAKEDAPSAMRRELKEELGADFKLTFIRAFPGTASWKGEEFPVLSHLFLAEPQGGLKLNEKENGEMKFLGFEEISAEDVAFDSNQEIFRFLKEKFSLDYARVKELVHQLDASAEVKEYSLYKAMLEGFVSTIYDGGKLIGMGWIFPRQTALRHQAVVEDMIVDDAYRGKGYGRKLLEELLSWAKEQGVEVVELTSGSHRVAANELYKRVGFKLHVTNHYLLKPEEWHPGMRVEVQSQ